MTDPLALFHSKPQVRKVRPALPINTSDFGRSISVPADRLVHKTTPPMTYGSNTPTTPELE